MVPYIFEIVKWIQEKCHSNLQVRHFKCLKFRFSDNATKIWKKSPTYFVCTDRVNVQTSGRLGISNFVAFSYMFYLTWWVLKEVLRQKWIRILSSFYLSQVSHQCWTKGRSSSLVGTIADQNFYALCFMVFYPTASAKVYGGRPKFVRFKHLGTAENSAMMECENCA